MTLRRRARPVRPSLPRQPSAPRRRRRPRPIHSGARASLCIEEVVPEGDGGSCEGTISRQQAREGIQSERAITTVAAVTPTAPSRRTVRLATPLGSSAWSISILSVSSCMANPQVTIVEAGPPPTEGSRAIDVGNHAKSSDLGSTLEGSYGQRDHCAVSFEVLSPNRSKALRGAPLSEGAVGASLQRTSPAGHSIRSCSRSSRTDTWTRSTSRSQATCRDRFDKPIQKPSITWMPGSSGVVAAPNVTNNGV